MTSRGTRNVPWWMLPVAGLFATLPLITRRVGDPDYWWHELTGSWMVSHRALARSELYTYTVPGTPWTDHEYLTQLLFYGLNRVGGLVLVSIAFAAIGWAGFWLLYSRIRERDHSSLIAGAALVLGAGAAFATWGPRPQMVDFLFVALELYWIERFLSGRSRALYWLPLVMVAWANLHGGFVFAFFILGLSIAAVLVRWLWERRARAQWMAARQMLVVLAGCVAASFLTPWGPSLFVYVWRTQFSSQQSSFIAEWQSPDFHAVAMLPLLLLLLALLAGLAWRRPRLIDMFLVLGTAVMALRAQLFTPIFVAAAIPPLTWQWSDLCTAVRARIGGERPRDVHPAMPAALMLLLGVVALAGVGLAGYTLRGQRASTAANYPVAAADWLAAHPGVGTRVFNEYSWGGYLAYRFHPDPNRRVFIYGEAELMGDDLLAEYVKVNQLHTDWAAVLDRYRVDYVVFPVERPLDAALAVSRGWRLAYSDAVADIFVRTVPA